MVRIEKAQLEYLLNNACRPRQGKETFIWLRKDSHLLEIGSTDGFNLNIIQLSTVENKKDNDYMTFLAPHKVKQAIKLCGKKDWIEINLDNNQIIVVSIHQAITTISDIIIPEPAETAMAIRRIQTNGTDRSLSVFFNSDTFVEIARSLGKFNKVINLYLPDYDDTNKPIRLSANGITTIFNPYTRI